MIPKILTDPELRAEFERQHKGRNLLRHRLRGTYSSPPIAALWNQHVKTAEWCSKRSDFDNADYAEAYAELQRQVRELDVALNSDLTPHLRQFRHNDEDSFVFGYDKAGIDREFARLALTAAPDPHAALLKLQSDLEQCNSSDWVLTFKEGVKLVQQAVAESAAIRLMQSVNVPQQGRADFIKRIVQGVAEMPDRDSPEDQPEMMLVTGEELRVIIAEAFEHADEDEVPAAPLPQPQAYEEAKQECGEKILATIPGIYALPQQGEGSIDSEKALFEEWAKNHEFKNSWTQSAHAAWQERARLARTAAPSEPMTDEQLGERLRHVLGHRAVSNIASGRNISLTMEQARDLCATDPAPSEGQAIPADLSKRLRAASTNFATTLLQSDILAAADEIDRYYGGMLAWKSSAKAKDAEIGELRGIIATKGGAA